MKLIKALSLALVLVSAGGFAIAQDSRPTSKPSKAKPWTPRKDCSGSYGAGLSKAKLDTVKLKTLMDKPKKYAGKKIRVQGVIQDVCQKKGCWLLLRAGKKTMRVRFKDYKFFVPTNSKKYVVTLEGSAKEITISEEMAKHYAEEGGDKEAAKKIKGPQKTLLFMAEGLKISKPKKK